ncbi:diaminopimelate decarboxylase [Candidatus Uhrbacteria bacterium]|nr:diaminopimelate decarboxylase [Candidatus Uhrbacteria bacterium]
MNITRQQFKKITEGYGTPAFVYDEHTLRKNIERIFSAAATHGLTGRVMPYVAYFANSNPHLFSIVTDAGARILIQTPEEYCQLKKFHLERNVLVSPSFLSDKDIDFWTKRGIEINLASMEEVEHCRERYPKKPVSIRIDCTKEEKQRMAIKRSQLPYLKKILAKTHTPLRSFQVYSGTGSSLETLKTNADFVFDIYARYFPQAKVLNFGGGFGFQYDAHGPEDTHFDWNAYFEHIAKRIKEKNIPDDITFIVEPGRDVFADAGSFLISVNRIVQTGHSKQIATDGSFVFMPSATVRTRQHRTRFFSAHFRELTDRDDCGFISGCTTLSSDYVFPGTIALPRNLQKGDYLLIEDIGAYGATQHMEFLNKRPCPEFLIRPDRTITLLTHRGSVIDKIRYTLVKPRII